MGTYRHLPRNLPDMLRDAGLRVVEVEGWYGRGRPASTGDFHPGGLLVHHTATSPESPDENVVAALRDGRDDLPGPLAQLGLARDGTVYVVASGRANHAGQAKPSGTMAGGDGNALYIGVECFNDGKGEKWPAVQYDALVMLGAVICIKVTGNSVQTVRGHKETSVTGKIDPRGIDMNELRSDIDAVMRRGLKFAPEPGTEQDKERWNAAMFLAQYGRSRLRLVIGGRIVGITEDLFDQLRKAGVPVVKLSDKDFENLTSVLGK